MGQTRGTLSSPLIGRERGGEERGLVKEDEEKSSGMRCASVVNIKSSMLNGISESSENNKYKYLRVSARKNESNLKKDRMRD